MKETANLFKMKFLIYALTGFAILSGAAANAAQFEPQAPAAVLSSTSGADVYLQTSWLLFSTWNGEEIDRSFPPVRWPRSQQVPAGSEFSLTIATSQAPNEVEVRVWKKLRPNGIPKGRPQLHVCTLVAPAESGCSFRPEPTTSGIQWRVTFPIDRTGHEYIATLANWPDSQVVWINHLKIKES
jgi:hypothetical protein